MKKATAKLAEVDSIYRNYYIDELDDDALIDGMLTGYVAGTGDKYGAYYNSEAFDTFISDLEGEVAGIGVTVIYNRATSSFMSERTRKPSVRLDIIPR